MTYDSQHMMEINLISHKKDHVSHKIANESNQVQSKPYEIKQSNAKFEMKANPRLSPPLAQDTKKGHT